MVEVRAYPCDPASDDYRRGPLLANNIGGLGEDENRRESMGSTRRARRSPEDAAECDLGRHHVAHR